MPIIIGGSIYCKLPILQSSDLSKLYNILNGMLWRALCSIE